MRSLAAVWLLAGCLTCSAQLEQAGVFHEAGTGLTLRFPVELTVRDAQKSIEEGHVAVFGSMQNAAKDHELAMRCMKPILLAELPDGSLAEKSSAGAGSPATLFIEFMANKECKKGFRYKDDEAVAGGIARLRFSYLARFR